MPFRKKNHHKKVKRFTDKPIPVTLRNHGFRIVKRHIYYQSGFGTFVKYKNKRILVSAGLNLGKDRNSAYEI